MMTIDPKKKPLFVALAVVVPLVLLGGTAAVAGGLGYMLGKQASPNATAAEVASGPPLGGRNATPAVNTHPAIPSRKSYPREVVKLMIGKTLSFKAPHPPHPEQVRSLFGPPTLTKTVRGAGVDTGVAGISRPNNKILWVYANLSVDEKGSGKTDRETHIYFMEEGQEYYDVTFIP